MRILVCVALFASLAVAQDPLPVARSARLRGGTYFVEGRKTIPKGVKLLCQKGVRIVGRGKEPVLRVEGDFETHGLRGSEVLIANLHIELAGPFVRMRLAFAKFQGTGGIRTAKELPARGTLHLEDVKFEGAADLRVTFEKGLIELKRTSSMAPAALRGVDANKPFKLDCFWCYQESEFVSGFHGGLLVEKVKDARVRWTRLGGLASSFRDCASLVLEACKLDSRTITITQTKAGLLGKTKILKCDFYAEELIFKAPKKKGKRDKVALDSCYFKNASKASTVLSERIDKPEHITVVIKKLLKKPKNLGGTDRRR